MVLQHLLWVQVMVSCLSQTHQVWYQQGGPMFCQPLSGGDKALKCYQEGVGVITESHLVSHTGSSIRPPVAPKLPVCIAGVMVGYNKVAICRTGRSCWACCSADTSHSNWCCCSCCWVSCCCCWTIICCSSWAHCCCCWASCCCWLSNSHFRIFSTSILFRPRLIEVEGREEIKNRKKGSAIAPLSDRPLSRFWSIPAFSTRLCVASGPVLLFGMSKGC